MTDSPDESDELRDLLAPPANKGENPGLRAELLRRTSAHLVKVKWLCRGMKAAAVAAVFALGVGVGEWRAAPRERFVTVRETETVTVAVPVVVPVAVSVPDPEPPAPALTAAKLELDAEQTDDAPAAARLYQQAGDAYLARERDYANAARCYRLFLARAGDPALTPAPGDSWLLTSIKNAHFKEKIHATVPNG